MRRLLIGLVLLVGGCEDEDELAQVGEPCSSHGDCVTCYCGKDPMGVQLCREPPEDTAEVGEGQAGDECEFNSDCASGYCDPSELVCNECGDACC